MAISSPAAFASWSEAWIAESLDVEESTLSQLARAVRYGEEQLDPNASESAVWNSSPPKAGVQPSVAHSQEALPGSRGPSPPCPDVSSWGAESVQVLLQERTIELELERARRQALQQALLEAEERARLLAQDREQLADRHRAELEDLAAACDAELAEARGLHRREVAELAAAYEAQLEGTQDQVAMLEDRLNVTQYGGTPMGHPNIQTRSDRGSPTNAMEAPVRDLFDSPMKGVCGTAQAGDAFCGMPPPLAAQPSLVSAASQQAVTADSCPWDSSSSDEDGAPAPHRSSPEIEVGAPRHVHGASTGGVEGSTSLHQAQQGTLAARPAPVPGTAAVEERHLRSEIAALNRKLERGGESLCKATHAIRVLHFKLQRERQSVARLQADKCMLQSRLLAALGEAVEAEGGLAGHGPPTSKQLQDSDTLPPEIDDQEADAEAACLRAELARERAALAEARRERDEARRAADRAAEHAARTTEALMAAREAAADVRRRGGACPGMEDCVGRQVRGAAPSTDPAAVGPRDESEVRAGDPATLGEATASEAAALRAALSAARAAEREALASAGGALGRAEALASALEAARGELAGAQARTSELQAALEAARADVALAADLQGGLRGGDRGADVVGESGLIDAVQALQVRNRGLTAALEASTEASSRGAERLERLGERCAAAEAAAERERERAERTAALLEAKAAELEAQAAHAAGARAELRAAEDAATARATAFADLEGQVASYQGMLASQEAILKRTVAALTSLRKRAGDDAARLATLKGAAGEAEALRKASGARERELGDCREARRVAEAACAAAEARALRLEGALSRLAAELASGQDALLSARREGAEALDARAALEARLEEGRARGAELEARVSRAEGRAAELEGAAAALRLLAQAHGYVFEEAVDAGAATCAEGPGRYASSEDAELCPLKSAVRHLDRALAAALAGRCEAETEREASRRALAAAERKLAEARAEAEGLRGRAAESSAAAAAAGADMALLEAQAGTLRRELEFLGLQLADAREEGEAGASRAAAEALERAAHQQVVVGGSRDAAQVVAELQPGIRAQEELLAAMGLDRVWQALVGLAGRKTPARSGCRSGTPPATPCSAPSASGWRALSQPPLESLALLAADVAWVLGEHPASLAAAGREGAPDPETTVAVLIEAVRSLMQRHRGVLRLLRGQGRVNDRNLADSASQAVSIGRHACTAGADQCRSPPARPSSHRGLVRERRGRRERERPAGLDAHSHVKQGLDRLIRAAGGPAWDDAALGSGIESEEEECIPLRRRFATPPAQALT
ncbi:hypothetical protein F751_1757 [Auxenochlorella protothecoides]|uniref:Uncharacterized protein n=1 Tax=Auxenochlorella protothecoides TaxID=3075 RepID=A0A087SGM4_AUXPR|nr:hypothetical protein F751_1757 [Auxenochlorella protothecoides]KFM24878.1 hypothetical protein F751_1757 [Auxenochlorella protothecoides]